MMSVLDQEVKPSVIMGKIVRHRRRRHHYFVYYGCRLTLCMYYHLRDTNVLQQCLLSPQDGATYATLFSALPLFRTRVAC